MLLAHGTTERKADEIEAAGHFSAGTYFLKLQPDPKVAVFGTAGFALRDHPLTAEFVTAYCKQDLLLMPLHGALWNAGQRYIQRKEDNSPGLIYIIDAPKEALDYERSIMRAIFIPGEVVSTEKISLASVQKILTLEENRERLREKYARACEELKAPSIDHILKRTYNTLYSRVLRAI